MIITDEGNKNAQVEINKDIAKACRYTLKAEEYLDA